MRSSTVCRHGENFFQEKKIAAPLRAGTDRTVAFHCQTGLLTCWKAGTAAVQETPATCPECCREANSRGDVKSCQQQLPGTVRAGCCCGSRAAGGGQSQ